MELNNFKANFLEILKNLLKFYLFHSFLKQFNSNFHNMFFLIILTTCIKHIKKKNEL